MNVNVILKSLLVLLLTSLCPSLAAQQIALTFDDAPLSDGPIFSGNERTQKLIEHLKQQKIEQVTFFVVTGNINEQSNKRLEKYADAGHLLANHTHSHQWIRVLGTAAYLRDIQRADSILRPMKGFAPWFRYPFLDEGRTKSSRDSIRQQLVEMRLINGYVTIDNYDWYLNGLLRKALQEKRKVNYDKLRSVYLDHLWNSIQFYDGIARRILGRSPRHVLLLHENDLAAYFLTDLIKLLNAKGWEIISPTEAYEDPIAGIVPDVLFNGQGRVAAMAKEKGFASKDLVQEAEDEAYLDELVRIRKVFE
jgi:peptidoglycan/xylan/chitin deacetylase (PgdA/CDA1 family)